MLIVCACEPATQAQTSPPEAVTAAPGPGAPAVSCDERLQAPSDDAIEAAAADDPACADALRLALASEHLEAHTETPDDAHLRAALEHQHAVILSDAAYEGRAQNVSAAARQILEVPPLADDVSVDSKVGRVADLVRLHEQLHGRQPQVDATILEVALARAAEVGDEPTAQVLRSNLVDAYLELADFDPDGGVGQLQGAKRLLEQILASKARKDLHDTAREQLVHVKQRLGE